MTPLFLYTVLYGILLLLSLSGHGQKHVYEIIEVRDSFQVIDAPIEGMVLEITITGDSTLYVGTTDQLLQSGDQGKQWKQLMDGYCREITLRNGTLYVARNRYAYESGTAYWDLVYSNDHGKSWDFMIPGNLPMTPAHIPAEERFYNHVWLGDTVFFRGWKHVFSRTMGKGKAQLIGEFPQETRHLAGGDSRLYLQDRNGWLWEYNKSQWRNLTPKEALHISYFEPTVCYRDGVLLLGHNINAWYSIDKGNSWLKLNPFKINGKSYNRVTVKGLYANHYAVLEVNMESNLFLVVDIKWGKVYSVRVPKKEGKITAFFVHNNIFYVGTEGTFKADSPYTLPIFAKERLSEGKLLFVHLPQKPE